MFEKTPDMTSGGRFVRVGAEGPSCFAWRVEASNHGQLKEAHASTIWLNRWTMTQQTSSQRKYVLSRRGGELCPDFLIFIETLERWFPFLDHL